jgi:transcription termination factor Rho
VSVLSRAALEESPLADLHIIATELGIDGFRRLKKSDLVDAILAIQGGEPEAPAEPEPELAEEPAEEPAAEVEEEVTDEGAGDDEPEEAPAPRARRSRRGGGGGGGRRESADDGGGKSADEGDRVAEGVVELLGNGSGFVRVNPPDPSDDDVYVSAAQVRRCELVSGDRVTGPVRAPRRSERYPSLIRVDTINDRPADEVAEGTHFDDLPAAFPTERFSLLSDDPTLRAIEWLTPIGRGSRATLVGPARSGKTEALRRLAAALNGQEGIEVSVVLAGARPEEVAEWCEAGLDPTAVLGLASSAEAQAQAIERAVETARRVAARGGHAVVAIDSLQAVPTQTARRILAAARNIVDGGSLTIIAAVSEPVGGETTVIAFDHALTSTQRYPALALAGSGTMRPELLVGQAGADAIAQARSAAMG